MNSPPEQMSQADFARHCGVSRAAVSQWKTNDILTEAAFSKPGKTGKLITAIALRDVERNRDIGQSLGNGITTKTQIDQPDYEPPLAQDALDAPELDFVSPDQTRSHDDVSSSVAAQKALMNDPLKLAKLEQMLRKNRLEAISEAQAMELLIDASDVRSQMARIAGMLMQVFEGALPDFATKIAEQFEVPQRDVLHLLKNEFRDVRQQASNKQRVLSGEKARTKGASIEVEH